MTKNSQELQNKELKTAVLFLVFNRPDSTKQVFEAIRKAKPPRLYVAADGPREDKLGEAERVEEVRTIATGVDWPCEVKTLFRDKNLGCKKGVSSAITWFFEQEERGIILEDDCLPHLDFFSFCENLLDLYLSDERIFAITGDNFQNGKWRGDSSYYFSKYNLIWGWATWRRAWKHYHGDINFWPKWKTSNAWTKYKSDKIERRYWQKIFDSCYAGQIDSWDYPWMASTWYKNGLTVTPNVNLVSNIGFGVGATHTVSKRSRYSNWPLQELSDIIHPIEIKRNINADKYIFHNFYGGKSLRFPLSLLNVPKKIILFILNKIYFFK
jgi:hypothetical protein